MKVVDIIQLDNIYAERVCDSSGWFRELILIWIEEFPARGTGMCSPRQSGEAASKSPKVCFVFESYQ